MPAAKVSTATPLYCNKSCFAWCSQSHFDAPIVKVALSTNIGTAPTATKAALEKCGHTHIMFNVYKYMLVSSTMVEALCTRSIINPEMKLLSTLAL
jgi:hypothetical protein